MIRSRSAFVVLAVVCAVGCGTGTKRSARAGLVVINPQFDRAGEFSEGLARVLVGDDKTGKWGFINKHGDYLVQSQFDRVDKFSEGLAAVLIGGKWGFIDKQGHFAVNPQLHSAERFSEGLAVALDCETSKWGYIDRQGHYVVTRSLTQRIIFARAWLLLRLVASGVLSTSREN